jgi:predicted esterase
MRALRMLCLHGFRGSGSALRAQMRKLVHGLEPELELLCPDAPARATGGPGWWNAVPLEGAAKHYQGWEQTRDFSISFFRDNGPIDGVFGFSQGAVLAALLVGLRSPSGIPTREQPLTFDFAILVGGFLSNDPAHSALYESAASFALPSLHMIGRADRIVASEASLALAARFKAPLLFEHDGGHVIPSTAEARATFSAFLASRAAR